MKEQHSSHLRKIGACLHERWNLRKENLLSTLERQCTWSAKKDLSNAEMDTLTKSCSPTIVITANGEVQTHELCMSKNWIYSWLWKSSTTRQQYCRSESFAMKTDVLLNGSVVKNHISVKKVFEYNGTRKTSFPSWFQACQVLPLHLHQLYGHLWDGRQSRQFFSWSFFRASLQRDVRIWVNTMFILISMQTEIARSVTGPRLQGLHAEDAMAKPYLEPQILVTWWQQITRS